VYPIHVLERPAGRDPSTLPWDPDNARARAPNLWDVIEPPERLFVQAKVDALGLLERLPEQGLAIVGTRGPQPRSLQLVRQTVAGRPGLRGSGLVIVSGLARGVDQVAHQAALDAGLKTVAVLGGGLDIPYPRESLDLRGRILETGGLLVSEFPPGTEPLPRNFLRRNRLVAGWSRAVWVVEAARVSGALNTASWGRQQGRAVFATPCFPGDPALAGNERLLDLEEALPWFGPQSLGSVWLELGSRAPAPAARSRGVPSGDARTRRQAELVRRVDLLTPAYGGAHAQELLDWALARGWTPEDYFLALRDALAGGSLSDEAGIVVSAERDPSACSASPNSRPPSTASGFNA
jgi:DNA protecting protein DprA